MVYEFDGKVDGVPNLVLLARVFKRAYDAGDNPLEVICTNELHVWARLASRFKIKEGTATYEQLLKVALDREGIPDTGRFEVDKVPGSAYDRKLTYIL